MTRVAGGLIHQSVVDNRNMTNGVIRPHTASQSRALSRRRSRLRPAPAFIARDAPISRAHEPCQARKAGRHASAFGPSLSAQVSAIGGAWSGRAPAVRSSAGPTAHEGVGSRGKQESGARELRIASREGAVHERAYDPSCAISRDLYAVGRRRPGTPAPGGRDGAAAIPARASRSPSGRSRSPGTRHRPPPGAPGGRRSSPTPW